MFSGWLREPGRHEREQYVEALETGLLMAQLALQAKNQAITALSEQQQLGRQEGERGTSEHKERHATADAQAGQLQQLADLRQQLEEEQARRQAAELELEQTAEAALELWESMQCLYAEDTAGEYAAGFGDFNPGSEQLEGTSHFISPVTPGVTFPGATSDRSSDDDADSPRRQGGITDGDDVAATTSMHDAAAESSGQRHQQQQQQQQQQGQQPEDGEVVEGAREPGVFQRVELLARTPPPQRRQQLRQLQQQQQEAQQQFQLTDWDNAPRAASGSVHPEQGPDAMPSGSYDVEAGQQLAAAGPSSDPSTPPAFAGFRSEQAVGGLLTPVEAKLAMLSNKLLDMVESWQQRLNAMNPDAKPPPSSPLSRISSLRSPMLLRRGSSPRLSTLNPSTLNPTPGRAPSFPALSPLQKQRQQQQHQHPQQQQQHQRSQSSPLPAGKLPAQRSGSLGVSPELYYDSASPELFYDSVSMSSLEGRDDGGRGSRDSRDDTLAV